MSENDFKKIGSIAADILEQAFDGYSNRLIQGIEDTSLSADQRRENLLNLCDTLRALAKHGAIKQ